MDDSIALHTAARSYCQERFSEWVRVYCDLQRQGNWRVENASKVGWDYSDEAYRTFPRYRLAKNTQIEIERLDVDSKMSVAEMRGFINTASDKARAKLLTELTNNLAQIAIGEEEEDFRVYVEALTRTDLVQVEPLPYRRVLGKEESERLWKELRKPWSIGDDYWFPLRGGLMPPNVLAFHTDYFQSINGQKILRETLVRRGVSTVFLLHEFGDPDYEIDIGIFEPQYGDGGEQYSTSNDTDWIVYASHESSITVGGEWLIQAFRSLHPECPELTYGGPYSTPDLRGNWGTS